MEHSRRFHLSFQPTRRSTDPYVLVSAVVKDIGKKERGRILLIEMRDDAEFVRWFRLRGDKYPRKLKLSRNFGNVIFTRKEQSKKTEWRVGMVVLLLACPTPEVDGYYFASAHTSYGEYQKWLGLVKRPKIPR